MRRAARWDGWIVGCVNEDGTWSKTPEQVAEKVAIFKSHRVEPGPFDIIINGYSEPGDTSMTHAFAEAGATWWLETLHLSRGSLDDMLKRILAGPPH